MTRAYVSALSHERVYGSVTKTGATTLRSAPASRPTGNFDALEEAIVIALGAVTATDATNCIRHAGYAVR